ncbi:C69 family dipeptidase [Lactobacillus plantarum]|uniref:C69 family dipeptidase n=1 Tax=Lactiplantibacillus plantarum TaxID=1590 RepID=UPI00143D69F2|nr:C69 family dipeptidase [Lactiplantibacillus plantarum]MBE1724927.1 C69 family dipeptidase [Lactiplantibacillus plantarum]NKI36964.1 C69 family dipeptidase [Lactiplantibacillus plantarum]
MYEQACTTILVGKKATVDGSTMIARNDDTFMPITPQKFIVHPAVHGRNETLTSGKNGFTAPLPADGYRYQAVPNIEVAEKGVFEENGFNEKNVGVSSTESVYGNEHTLTFDPFVPNGLAEDSLPTMLTPFIDSARGGVAYLGQLIAKYGSPEGNGVLFNDKDDVWYMEIVTGHHWVAQRIPDDAYAVAANQVAIQWVDFDDPDNFMWSDGIQEFVAEHHLNPDKEGFNFRHIFGTDNEKDRHYNTPRVWYGQRYFNPEIEQDPQSSELPFICHAAKKISVADVEFVLGSHYNETKYDPFLNTPEAKKFRPISMNRTQNSHVMQVRNDVPAEQSAIMWMTFGVPAFAPYLPFHANVSETDPSFANTPLKHDMNSAYWLYRTLSMIVESHYADFVQDDIDYLKECRIELGQFVAATDEQAAKLSGDELTAFLTEQDKVMVAKMRDKAQALIGQLVTKGLTLSKLTYNVDINL